MTVYVSVQSYWNCHHYLVRQSTTVQQIFDYVADRIELRNRSLFGLYAWRKASEAFVWLKPNDGLLACIKAGIQFEPVLSLHLMPISISNTFEHLKEDSTALLLFYEKMNLGRHKEYYANCIQDLVLLSLKLQIEEGSLVMVERITNHQQLIDLVCSYFTVDNETDLNIACETVLYLWNFISSLTTKEAIFNYLSIGATNLSDETGYETMTFGVQPIHSPVVQHILVCFKGIRIFDLTPNYGYSNKKSFLWSDIQKLRQHKRKIIIQLFDEQKNELKYDLGAQYLAKRFFQVFTTYHQMYLKSKHSIKQESIMFMVKHEFFQSLIKHFVENKQLERQTKLNEQNAIITNSKVVNGELEQLIVKLQKLIEDERKKSKQVKEVKSTVHCLQSLNEQLFKKMELFETITEQLNIIPWNRIITEMTREYRTDSEPSVLMPQQQTQQTTTTSTTASCQSNDNDGGDAKLSETDQMIEDDEDDSDETKELEQYNPEVYESTRRKRFAKLRLSLFEHERN